MSESLLVQDYTLLEQVHLLAGFMDILHRALPSSKTSTSADRDYIRDPGVLRPRRPRANGRAEVFDDWYPMVDSPVKDVTYRATSGRSPV